MNDDRFWKSLSAQTRNALRDYHVSHPWTLPVGELLRIPRIGPSAVREIAEATQKNWSRLVPPTKIRRVSNDL